MIAFYVQGRKQSIRKLNYAPIQFRCNHKKGDKLIFPTKEKEDRKEYEIVEMIEEMNDPIERFEEVYSQLIGKRQKKSVGLAANVALHVIVKPVDPVLAGCKMLTLNQK